MQTVLRTYDNDSSFWVGDTMTEKPHHNDTRIALHNCNGGLSDSDDNYIKSKFSRAV